LAFEIPWTNEQKIFIVEAYFRKNSIHAAQLQFKDWFGCREFPVHSMIYRWVNKFRTHWTVHNLNCKDTNRQSHSGWLKSSRTPHNIAAVRDSVLHSPSKSVCRRSQELGINRESVQIILIADLHMYPYRIQINQKLTPDDMRMVPPHTPQTNHWHVYSSVSLTDWSAAGVTRSGRRIHWTWTPPDFYLWGYLKDRVYGNDPQTILDLKAAITAAIRAIPREECRRVIKNFARWIQMCLQHREAHLEHIFWAPVKQRVFVVQTWNFGWVCYTGLS